PIESTSPLSAGENVDGATLPAALVPSEPIAPDRAFEEKEVRDRIRAAIASLPPRERRVVALYYYGEATMKQIGAEIGVNESRVSQLHARAIRRLRDALGSSVAPAEAAKGMRGAVLAFQQKPKMAKATLESRGWTSGGGHASNRVTTPGVVVNYASVSRAARSKSGSRNGLGRAQQT